MSMIPISGDLISTKTDYSPFGAKRPRPGIPQDDQLCPCCHLCARPLSSENARMPAVSFDQDARRVSMTARRSIPRSGRILGYLCSRCAPQLRRMDAHNKRRALMHIFHAALLWRLLFVLKFLLA